MSFPARNLQLIDAVAGKARDYDLTLTLSGVSLTVADILDAWFTAKGVETDADADAVIAKRLAAGISLTGVSGTSVIGIVSLNTTDTAALTPGRVYYFDVQVKTAVRGPETAAFGRLTCRRPITSANS